MNKRKILVAVDSGFNDDYKTFLEKRFEVETITFEEVLKGRCSETINLLLFTGGSDVEPNRYGENVGNHTSTNARRDKEESSMYDHFFHVPKLGICRGSQALTVFNGGKLIQHVSGHAGASHYIQTENNNFNENKSYLITSTHHQMMYPFNLSKNKYELVAWSKKFLSDTYLDGENMEKELPNNFLEPEIVFYNQTNSLAIQGHPEFANCKGSTVNFCLNLIQERLLKQK